MSMGINANLIANGVAQALSSHYGNLTQSHQRIASGSQGGSGGAAGLETGGSARGSGANVSVPNIDGIDIAQASTELARNQVMTQASVAMLAQANTLPAMALKLLG